MTKSVVLADPRGFCAGVDRAILTVQTILKAAEASGKRTREDGLPPVYVRRQIVHNKHVVEDLAGQGAVFVQELAEIPDAAAQAGIPVVFSAHGVSPVVKAEAERRGMHVVDATCPLVGKVHREVLRFVREGYEIVYIGHKGIPVVFSAHGVSPVVKAEAERRGMHVVDATCPLVGKVHREVLRFVREGYEIVYIGHKGHDEAVGVVGESPEHVHLIEHESDVDSLDFAPDTKLVLLSQTTLSVDETADTIAALKAKFPWIQEPPSSDICYATSNRQAAVKLVAQQSDCVVIVGSANSSNSVRLMEVAQEGLGERGKAYRVDDASELDPAWFEGLESVGISSGASVPDELVSGVIDALQNLGFTGMKSVETIKENMHFVLPAELRRKK